MGVARRALAEVAGSTAAGAGLARQIWPALARGGAPGSQGGGLEVAAQVGRPNMGDGTVMITVHGAAQFRNRRCLVRASDIVAGNKASDACAGAREAGGARCWQAQRAVLIAPASKLPGGGVDDGDHVGEVKGGTTIWWLQMGRGVCSNQGGGATRGTTSIRAVRLTRLGRTAARFP